jgi:hypothetical protein
MFKLELELKLKIIFRIRIRWIYYISAIHIIKN